MNREQALLIKTWERLQVIRRVYLSKKKKKRKRDQNGHFRDFQHTLKYMTLGKLLKGIIQTSREEQQLEKKRKNDFEQEIHEESLNRIENRGEQMNCNQGQFEI